MYLATKEDIYFIDEECEKKYNIPTLELMENAGKNSFVWIKENLDLKKNFLVFCGHGNNGGDGAVLARYLIQNGVNTKVVFVGDVIEKTKGVAKENFLRLKEFYKWDFSIKGLLEIKDIIENSDYIIDAIFGVGLKGELYQPIIDLIEQINSSGKVIISLDIPSGVLANGGNFKIAVKANYTLTFGLPKFGMIDYPGADFCGKIESIDIGIPQNIIEERKPIIFLTDNYVSSLLQKRKRDSHKGKFGHLLIVGGYGGNFKKGIKAMGGSVILSGLSALRSGVGLLTIATHIDNLTSIQASIPEAMTFGWKESNSSLRSIRRLIENNFIKTVLVGNGFFTGKFQEKLIEMILTHPVVDKIVIDADGINNISQNERLMKILKSSGKNIILTPHIGEASRMLDLHPEIVKFNKLDMAKKLNQLTNSVILLKDSVSVISSSERLFVNNRGSVSLAKGGSGDILAGLVAGFLASGHSAVSSAIIGSYLLGLAGEKCENIYGSFSTTGSDVINIIPEVIKYISMLE
ncbi:MAG: NAD(P)H-hydrate dehydratase [Brevinematia bacterium]